MLSSDSGFSVLLCAHRHFRTLTNVICIVVILWQLDFSEEERTRGKTVEFR